MLIAEDLATALNRLQEQIPLAIKTYNTFPGINVESCEKEAIYQENKMVLYRYKPITKKKNPIPLLIVFALINRPYILDLISEYSTIKKILSAGIDVYLIDWGYPDANDSSLTLNHYINGAMKKCVEVVRKKSAQEKINLLGICQGGTFCVCYSCLYPKEIKNLITMVTPIDFHTPDNNLYKIIKDIKVDLFVDALANIPGVWLAQFFLSLIPSLMLGKKYVDFLNMLDNPLSIKRFLAMEKWIFDCPDQAGTAFSEFIKNFYQENQLIKGELKLGRRKVNLRHLNMPILNIIAGSDHLIPASASLPLAKLTSSKDVTQQVFPGGHIGIYISNKTQELLVPILVKWLNERM